ncbi:MAG: sensor histidine kinase [Nonomuraea sp.]|nr:sensor histidine kinase [Nonomuraea sp.]NUS08488.1 sensor histidine kinase [Nonomuraea sp.]
MMTSSSAQRLARVLITGVSVAYSAIGLLYVLVGPVTGLIAALVMIAVVATHYVNMRAALRGGRPPYFPVTLLLQVAATYVGDFLLPGGWSSISAPLLAGTLLVLLPLRWAAPLVALMVVREAAATWMGLQFAVVPAFYAVAIPITGAMIHVLVRLVRVAADLEEARAELADAAVLKERLRISRDLHDGLGRSLTAIALKGDLATRLMDRDPGAARGEVGELVRVAREAAQDVRQVARGYRAMSLTGEVDRAAALLESAGVSCQTHLADLRPSRRSEEALAWGVREAVTNVLRHSRATTCTITTSAGAGRVRLEVANDGVSAAPGEAGGGLTGLAERASQAGGTCAAAPTGETGFLLTMEVPA